MTASGPQNEPPMLAVLNAEDFPNVHTIGQAIRQLLAQNCAVAIRPITEPEYIWNPVHLRELFGSGAGDLSMTVEWQSACDLV